jgi:hypothetical protein
VDRSGRFNFWRTLICTRAITPPRVVRGLWLQVLGWPWWAAVISVCLGVGIILQLGSGDPPAHREAVINSTLKPAVVQTAAPKQPW